MKRTAGITKAAGIWMLILTLGLCGCGEDGQPVQESRRKGSRRNRARRNRAKKNRTRQHPRFLFSQGRYAMSVWFPGAIAWRQLKRMEP